MTKKLVIALYTLIVVCIGLATVVEKLRGTPFVTTYVYGAWWFSALWAALTVAACAYILNQRLYKRMALMLLHAAFVVILAGALVTHLFAKQGTVRLRTGIAEITYVDQAGTVERLPFALTLKEFRIVHYPGTDAPLDYQSVILSSPLAGHADGQGKAEEILVSMNNIGTVDGYRLMQAAYDDDGGGVSLGVTYDPYGIAVTYIGYLLLLAGILATLFSRKTQMRTLYRKATLVALLAVCAKAQAADARTAVVVDKDIAQRLGTVSVLYNNRICPLNTVATDFVTKLTGNASWNGYTADEIFVSWMIYYTPWEQQKLIRIKNREVQQLLGISGSWAAYSDFIDEHHEYKLKAHVDALSTAAKATAGNAPDRKALRDADEKFHLVEMFYGGQFIRMFPFSSGGSVSWYTPGAQTLPKEIPVKEQFFIKQAMDYLTESIVTGNRDRAFEIIAKIKLFQRDMIGHFLPDGNKTSAELFFNALRTQKWPVFLALTLCLMLCVAGSVRRLQGRTLNWARGIVVAALFIYVTLQLALRWWLSGHVPLSNGHETMLFMAWVLLVITFRIRTDYAPLAAAFCLLVSMLAGSGQQLTPLMPVLQSPLLSLHVLTVMCAYALFALQLILGVQALVLIRKKKAADVERITALSQLLLYPAVFLLAIGIFLGAVWANVAWGNYWSWDPKEAWALITFMVYAVPFHKDSLTAFRKPVNYHLYIVTAFLVVIFTYWGVNYLLGGMHSYAG